MSTGQFDQGQPSPPSTYFASPDRYTVAEIKDQASRINEPIVRTLLSTISGYAMILNDYRQILAANEELLLALGLDRETDLLALKPGEAWGCQNAKIGPSGCGTSKRCKYCGALIATMSTMKTHTVENNECHLTMERNGVFETRDMKVHSAPLKLSGMDLVVVVFIDITNAVNKEFLERAFFHDLNNMLTGLLGWSDLLNDQTSTDTTKAISDLAELLCSEVAYHRLVSAAESGELTLTSRSVPIKDLIDKVKMITSRLPEASGIDLRVEIHPVDAEIMTDERLVVRILANLLKNAYEASVKGDRVNLNCVIGESGLLFSVNNRAVMPHDVSRQIFKKTFTTKNGVGRGMGTYIAKMFGEHYLHGEVYFNSVEPTGTIFFLRLPNFV